MNHNPNASECFLIFFMFLTHYQLRIIALNLLLSFSRLHFATSHSHLESGPNDAGKQRRRDGASWTIASRSRFCRASHVAIDREKELHASRPSWLAGKVNDTDWPGFFPSPEGASVCGSSLNKVIE